MTHHDHHPPNAGDTRCRSASLRGIEFLRRRQLPSGEFETLVGPDPDLLRQARPDPSLFATMHVANSLLEVCNGEAADMVRRAAAFLRSEMLPGGLWRFWTASHPGSPGIPPDTDDTACITHLLRRLGMPVPDSRGCLLANRDRHGRFRTWILPRPGHLLRPRSWPMLRHARRNRDRIALFFRSGPEPPPADGVDVVVNANALLLFGDGAAAAPIVAWIARVLDEGDAASRDRWYQSDLALFYAVSRGVEHGVKSLASLAERVVAAASRIDVGTLHPLDTALLLCVLATLGGPPASIDVVARSLVDSQREDGSWPARVFYYSGFGKDLSWGSAELTTAFCVEALARAIRMHG